MPIAQQRKILILSCCTGEGHNSAANAIAAVFMERGIKCEVCDVLSFKSEKAQQHWTRAYTRCVVYAPSLFGFIYGLGEVYDKFRMPSPVYAYNATYADRLYAYITDNGFTAVVCTHLYAMNAMAAVRKKFGCGIKCYAVLTDYTTVPFCRNTNLDTYFVADNHVCAQLVKQGVPFERISVTGIPVHPKFNIKIDKAHAREQLNLPPDKKVIAVMAGGAGCGKLKKLCRKLCKTTDEDCIIQVFSGRNMRLKNALEKRFRNCDRVQVVEYTDKVHLYMRACDVLISKPGGLSSTEAAVVNVPTVLIITLPGLEVYNMKKFTENGMAYGHRRISAAVGSVRQLLYDEDAARTMCVVQHLTVNGMAARRIAERICKEGVHEHGTVVAVHNGGFRIG